MRNRKTIMGFGLLAAVLFLAVGYAAISNIDFAITGTASAEVDTGLFEVAFDKNEEKTTTSNTGTTATVTASVTGDQSAEFVVSGLKKKNETVTATYTIKNSSDTLDAKLSEPIVTLSGEATSFYDVTAVYGNGSEETPILEVDDTITLTVTVKMKKTPIDTVNDVKPVTISISFSAEPVQPGSEGSGGSSSGSLPETDAQLYFDKPYIGYYIEGILPASFVFHEDGSAELYLDCSPIESAPEGWLQYNGNQIIIDSQVMGTISSDKKTITLLNEDGSVEAELTLSDEGLCNTQYANLPMMISGLNLYYTLSNNNINDISVIKTITLENSINVPEDVTSFDVSYTQNGKVMAYVTTNAEDSNYYDLYIQGDGALYAPENSFLLFAYPSLTQINNLNLLNTSYAVNMAGMFEDAYKLTSLDLSNFDTSNVTDMSYMFNRTENLTSLDLSSFDTSKVTDMSWMFNQTGYTSTEFTLNLGDNFDTSNVTNMSSMFYNTGYNSTKFALDCSNWNVDNVTNYSSFNGGVESKVTAPTWKN